MHEASLSDRNCFLTLTYSDEFLPSPYRVLLEQEVAKSGSLLISDFQRFMKRLRKKFSCDRIRFFHCGEYGDRTRRPHYHALIFGWDPVDKVPWTERNSLPVWRSAVLSQLWPLGQTEVGSLTFESAAYVARYCLKKVNGSAAASHYEVADVISGVCQSLQPEYATMSRRPGIGTGWLEKFRSDVYPSDQVVSRGFAAKPPRFYDDWLERSDPELLLQVKEARKRDRTDDDSRARLAVREVCTSARLDSLSRSL